jgi:hypothetical protein
MSPGPIERKAEWTPRASFDALEIGDLNHSAEELCFASKCTVLRNYFTAINIYSHIQELCLSFQ